MAWNLVAPNTWKNDRSNYVIEYDPDYSQYVIRSMDGNYTIPFDDIFNNPVFPADFSQISVLGKHFRAEANNTPATPGFSFQGDINTGFYRVSEDTIGVSIGGNKVSEINNFGVLDGTPGTDFRNLIKRQYSVLTGTANTQSTSEVSTGIGFSYTPINAGSKLKINISITHQTSYNTQNATPSYGFLRLYSTTGSIPTAGNSPTGTAISSIIINTKAYNFSPYLWDNSTHLNLQFWIDSLNINARNIYLVHSVGTSNLISTVYSTSYHSNYMVEEYL